MLTTDMLQPVLITMLIRSIFKD